MKTQAELRAFALGTVAGIAIWVGVMMLVCAGLGIKFQPVAASWF